MSYCYLNDAMGFSSDDKFKAEDYKCCDPEAPCLNRKCGEAVIKGKCYMDPDASSINLYSDLMVLFGDILSIKSFERKYMQLFDGNRSYYSSDYIGPSRYWAKKCGISNEEIGRSILLCRTIGGHMLWPVHKIPTVNTARGGRGFYDRIDMTLYEIKRYYELHDIKQFCDVENNSPFKYKTNDTLWRLLNERTPEQEFFSRFKGFKDFIDSFCLNSFVTDEYEVISLAKSKCLDKNESIVKISADEEIFPSHYDIFMKNNIFAVQNRTANLIKIARESNRMIMDMKEENQ